MRVKAGTGPGIKSEEADASVVCRNDPSKKVHLKYHWDVRKAEGDNDDLGTVIPGSARETFYATPSILRDLGPTPDDPPYKVRVSPLGEITRVDHD